jgi:hypothetical protein
MPGANVRAVKLLGGGPPVEPNYQVVPELLVSCRAIPENGAF